MNKKLAKKTILTTKLSKIYGGRSRATTGPTKTNEYGCVMYTNDVYEDANNDGVMNSDEWRSLTTCVATDCP
ncbi:hypothetical protein SAMN05421796_101346 [Chryseobacterium piscicola]|uniref:EF-hand domain-containing protein n=1 Tax=Chryseobacterium piscicola TaxID=551459 RepID=A0A1N7K6C6_9FLAO|nr:hypothetical protein [Chryseobacterium piscicola]PQA96478.1 hypothetical protein B0A70_05015 [Chryseobacterium piscicola]SIS57107.1 hypothetical protein SAMN05421796_101346 [Chryseobacterium piscicola]